MANLFKKPMEYTVSYHDIKGVELGGSGIDISKNRLAYSENMYRDYFGDGKGAVESIPGYRRLFSLGNKINAIYLQKTYRNGDFLLIHSGNSLYRIKISEIDNINNPQPIVQLSGNKSCGFSEGNGFFILDGKNIIKISEEGEAIFLNSPGAEPYVPTLYINEEEYERRNILSNKFCEEFSVGNSVVHTYGSFGILYEILDSDLRTCSVVGAEESLTGDLYIPNTVKIGNTPYRVVGIEDNAFSGNKKITSLIIAEGVLKIGKFAFRQCTEIKSVAVSNSVTEIDNAAFADCAKTEEIYLGKGLKKLGTNVFSSCIMLKNIYYSGSQEDFTTIENIKITDSYEKTYNKSYNSTAVEFELLSNFESIESVEVDGKNHPFVLKKYENKAKVVLFFTSRQSINGKTVKVFGTLKTATGNFGNSENGIVPEVLSEDAIVKCTVAEAFDGRIFLSGNSEFPNAVFYTSYDKTGKNNPLYISDINYFCDGIGRYPVISMLAVRDSLAVFKSGDDGDGSIFYHSVLRSRDKNIPTLYPVSYVHSGIYAVGESKNFLDDPVFISSNGICALNQKAINYERSIAIRSHNVNFDLLKEDISKASLTEWLGYLVVGVNGKIFLADSRSIFMHITGNQEYEWFLISNVGSYENSKRVYRYSSIAKPDYSINADMQDCICEKTVYSENLNGDTIYYSLENGKKYELYSTEQMTGGDFSPANIFFSYENLLFFGTDTGVISVFNNDKRGVAPDFLASSDDFDAELYKKEMGTSIHHNFYSFDNHSVRYAVKTVFDNCDIPHLTKSTVKHSLVVKCRCFPSSEIHCEVGTDKSGYSEVTNFPGGDMDFSDLDFSRLNITNGEYHSIPISEKEKNWVEKQITVYSDGFRSPFGIYSITYRFNVKGKIKKS